MFPPFTPEIWKTPNRMGDKLSEPLIEIPPRLAMNWPVSEIRLAFVAIEPMAPPARWPSTVICKVVPLLLLVTPKQAPAEIEPKPSPLRFMSPPKPPENEKVPSREITRDVLGQLPLPRVNTCWLAVPGKAVIEMLA